MFKHLNIGQFEYFVTNALALFLVICYNYRTYTPNIIKTREERTL